MSIYFQQKAVGEISKHRNGTRNKILTKYQLPMTNRCYNTQVISGKHLIIIKSSMFGNYSFIKVLNVPDISQLTIRFLVNSAQDGVESVALAVAFASKNNFC